MSDTTTRGIRIEVESTFLPERSEPSSRCFFFSYRVRITNLGDRPAQLISREWIITDSEGKVERVVGPGVVGEQPLLQPGESFEYTSFCPLPTPVGTMHGRYMMRNSDGSSFDANIDPFTLAVPGSVN